MARLDMDRFTKVGTGEEGMAVSDQQPKLNKITISCDMELEGTGEKLGMTLEAACQDVIGGLMDLVDLGIIDRPNPCRWPTCPLQGGIRKEVRQTHLVVSLGSGV
jgi:hypothetical protein